MDHQRRDSDTAYKKIVALWPLVVALISMVAMATTIKNRVDDHEIRLARLENAMGRIDSNTARLVNELLDRK